MSNESICDCCSRSKYSGRLDTDVRLLRTCIQSIQAEVQFLSIEFLPGVSLTDGIETNLFHHDHDPCLDLALL